IFGNDGTRPDDSSVADSHRFANDRIHSDKDTLADNDPAGAEISGERIVIMGQNGRSGSDQRMVSDGDVFRTKRIETYAGPYENIAFRGGGKFYTRHTQNEMTFVSGNRQFSHLQKQIATDSSERVAAH